MGSDVIANESCKFAVSDGRFVRGHSEALDGMPVNFDTLALEPSFDIAW